MKFKLKDVCTRLSSGKGISSKFISESGNFPVYGGNGLRGYTEKSNFIGECAIIGRQGAFCGNVRYFFGEAYMTEHAVVVCANENHDTRYLSYLLASMQLGRLSGQSAQPGLSVKVLAEQEVDMPPLAQQKKVTSILASIENKIELNNKINKNLLQQAVAVFNKFYDASTNQQPFTTLINVLGGGTPKTGNPEFWEGSIPFFTPKDVGTPYAFKTEKYITELGLKYCNSRLYPINTTFVTARGTVGKISLAGTPMAMNQSCYALTSEIVDPLLVYFYVLKAVNALKHKASGAVFDAIVTRDFDGEIINILSDTDSETALSIIKPMMGAIHNNSKENMRLSAVRDTLLPNLMSGEINISSSGL